MIVKSSYGSKMSTSAGVMPAMPNASRPETVAGVTVRSGHLRDVPLGMALPGTDDTDRLLDRVPGAGGAGDDECAAPVGHQAAVEAVERVADHPRGEHVFDGQRVATHALGLSRAHLRAATATSASCSEVVPYWCMWRRGNQGVVADREREAVWRLELGGIE